jgi:hypothetical protein
MSCHAVAGKLALHVFTRNFKAVDMCCFSFQVLTHRAARARGVTAGGAALPGPPVRSTKAASSAAGGAGQVEGGRRRPGIMTEALQFRGPAPGFQIQIDLNSVLLHYSLIGYNQLKFGHNI